jgi:hypothetical protein
MRPDGVAVPAPGLDQDPRLPQAVEDLPVQQLVPELTSLTPSAYREPPPSAFVRKTLYVIAH